MIRLLRALRPVDGAGSRSWDYPCSSQIKTHECAVGRHHDYRHRCGCGFRWAA